MGPCAQTSCGKAFVEWKAVKEMNKNGVYTPEQIQDAVEKAWKEHNPDDSAIVGKE